MKRLIISIILFAIYSNCLIANNNRAMIQTAFVIQDWKIEDMENRIAEGAFPINIIIPIKGRINLQISHSPAISRFGEIELSGLSDTWIRGTYAFENDKIMISGGIGIPTGKKELDNEEAFLSSLLSQNAFKFILPVFGQGFVASAGVVFAHPLSDQFAVGGGLNFVYKGRYKYTQYEFDPGEQIGMNIGFDYNYSSSIKLNFDVLYTYYMKDKTNNPQIFGNGAKMREIFGAGGQIVTKAGITYHKNKMTLSAHGRIRYSNKNEIFNGMTLVTEKKNSNIFQMELEAIYRLQLSQMFSIDLLLDGRSYIENEYGLGQADIFGVGIGNIIQLTPDLAGNILFKKFIGEGYFNHNIPNFSGTEFRIGTTIKL